MNAPVASKRVEMFWSFSTLSMFENCPRKYWAVKVAKKVSDVMQQNIGGDEEHQSIELYFKKGLRLAPALLPLEPLFQHLQQAPGEQYIEHMMCLTEQLVPTKFKDWNQGWVRGAVDYLKVNGDKATYLDWKSGKPRTEIEDQIELMSLLVFRHFPNVQQVNGGLFYYRHNKLKPHIVHRADESRLWNGYYSRTGVMLRAIREQDFPPTPNPLCAWCPYTECQFNTMHARLQREANQQG